MPSAIYQGSCHCGRVKFEAEAAINVCCIEGIDLAALPVTHHDGRAM
ncbi:MAG TPA: hypothetical protein VLA61_18385 [Ideonella sp.]|nr:hypothetical protein [Ideonella sp.]HSI50244.1 hypothetical protein [Ideonella sp.]